MRKKLTLKEKREIVKKIKNILSKRMEIEFSLLFGSFLTNIPFEDIDIAIYLNDRHFKKINKINYLIEITLLLEDKIKNYNFDIVILNDLNFNFIFNVFKEGRLLFARNKNKYYDFVIYIVEQYLDFKTFRDYLLKELV